ncbi:MAG: ribosomal protein S18-alanine N-acetyltransferase [Anaerolineae bacterium]
MAVDLPYVVEPMTLADLGSIMEIERVAFSTPWSARAYRYEITQNEHSIMLVVRPAVLARSLVARLRNRLESVKPGPLLGYAGLWLLVDEAHICTIAVHPERRCQGLGELLLIALLDQAMERGARRGTLEVRVTNLAAQGLYHKYGFEIVSVRKRYYSDNGEDAYIMTTPPFDTAEFQSNLQQRRIQLYKRFRAQAAAP